LDDQEFMAGGNLAIEMLRSQRLDEDRARLYAAELVRVYPLPHIPRPLIHSFYLQIVCIEELRKKGVVHRDIKPANILFTPDGHLRLLRLGLSARYTPRPDDEDLDSSSCALAFEVDETADSGSFFFPVQDSVWTSSLRCGTCHFMTPEQHEGLSYGIEVDGWAIGVILPLYVNRSRSYFPSLSITLLDADFSVV
jgi:serine/threonine protein kinase